VTEHTTLVLFSALSMCDYSYVAKYQAPLILQKTIKMLVYAKIDIYLHVEDVIRCLFGQYIIAHIVRVIKSSRIR
jgi:hypothetical protein